MHVTNEVRYFLIAAPKAVNSTTTTPIPVAPSRSVYWSTTRAYPSLPAHDSSGEYINHKVYDTSGSEEEDSGSGSEYATAPSTAPVRAPIVPTIDEFSKSIAIFIYVDLAIITILVQFFDVFFIYVQSESF